MRLRGSECARPTRRCSVPSPSASACKLRPILTMLRGERSIAIRPGPGRHRSSTMLPDSCWPLARVSHCPDSWNKVAVGTCRFPWHKRQTGFDVLAKSRETLRPGKLILRATVKPVNQAMVPFARYRMRPGLRNGSSIGKKSQIHLEPICRTGKWSAIASCNWNS